MSLIFDERNVAKILDDAIIANPQIKQKDIAEAAGFEKPNVIYMFKRGLSKVPLDKAGRVAKAVGLEPREFWFKCLHEYMPDVYKEFEMINKQPTLTALEIRFIKAARIGNIDLMEVLKNVSDSKIEEGAED